MHSHVMGLSQYSLIFFTVSKKVIALDQTRLWLVNGYGNNNRVTGQICNLSFGPIRRPYLSTLPAAKCTEIQPPNWLKTVAWLIVIIVIG
jgi:hypothetical protein